MDALQVDQQHGGAVARLGEGGEQQLVPDLCVERRKEPPADKALVIFVIVLLRQMRADGQRGGDIRVADGEVLIVFPVDGSAHQVVGEVVTLALVGAKAFDLAKVGERAGKFLVKSGADPDGNPGDKACVHVEHHKRAFKGQHMAAEEVRADHIAAGRQLCLIIFFVPRAAIFAPLQRMQVRKAEGQAGAVVKAAGKLPADQVGAEAGSVAVHVQAAFSRLGKVCAAADVAQLLKGVDRLKIHCHCNTSECQNDSTVYRPMNAGSA